jgi:hypothetical protein
MQKELEKEEINTLIQKSLVKKDTIQAWDIHSDNLTMSNLEIKAVRKDKNEIEMITNTAADFESLKKMIKGIGKLNFFIGEENLVFYSELKKFSEEGVLIVSLPEKWLIEERRYKERIITNGLGHAHIKNKSVTSILTLVDVSGSGFSVVMKKIDAMKFKEGMVLEDCSLELLDQTIEMSFKIERVKKFKHYEYDNFPYEVSVLGISYADNNDEIKVKILSAIEELKSELSMIID